jgi:hypothetical protein
MGALDMSGSTTSIVNDVKVDLDKCPEDRYYYGT